MTDAPPPPLPPPVPPVHGPGAPPPTTYYAAPPAGFPGPSGQPLPPGYYLVARRPTNVMAIVAFVLSLVSLWLTPIVGSIAAIILAYQARKQILVTREEGGGLATAGLIIGWVGLGLWVGGTVLYIAFLIALIAMAPSTY